MEYKCDGCRTKKRTDDEYKKLINRLKRIEGQVRGVRSMVESDVYCIDILTQVSAISSALTSFSKELLESHIKTCVFNDVRSGKNETLDELVEIISRMVK